MGCEYRCFDLRLEAVPAARDEAVLSAYLMEHDAGGTGPDRLIDTK